MSPQAYSADTGPSDVMTYDRRKHHVFGPPPAAADGVVQGDDSGRLMVLLVIFTIAILVVVVALIGAAAIGTGWALAGVLVVHVLMSAASFAGVIFLLSGSFTVERHALRL